MSFVYAEKYFIDEDRTEPRVNIYSDTKTTLIGAVLANWSEKERTTIEKYGFIKSVNIGPTCCISFAGNNTMYAQRLLKWIFEKRFVSDDELIEKAFQLHREACKDDIEFIICSADSGRPIITCIKNGVINNDVSSAWIGSPDAFHKMQELRKDLVTDISLFSKALEECGDDSVGGFVIRSTYDGKEFFYPERLESSVERKQLVRLGENITLFDPAEKGGYTIHFRESKQNVIIDFLQSDHSVIYSASLRYKSEQDNLYKEHLMLPMLFCTSTNICI